MPRPVAGRLVLGADQTLALGARRFSQARRLAAAARDQLKALRGQTHELTLGDRAGCADGAIVFEHREVARLTMRAFCDAFLGCLSRRRWAARHRDVGGYQLEGRASSCSSGSRATIS